MTTLRKLVLTMIAAILASISLAVPAHADNIDPTNGDPCMTTDYNATAKVLRYFDKKTKKAKVIVQTPDPVNSIYVVAFKLGDPQRVYDTVTIPPGGTGILKTKKAKSFTTTIYRINPDGSQRICGGFYINLLRD